MSIRTRYRTGLWHPYEKPMYGVLLNPYHPLARGLVGCWLFNEGGGNVVYDLSRHGNHGLLGGGTAGYCPAWITGKFGSALSFDGENDYVDCGNDESLNPSDEITIEAWIKISALPSHGKAIVAKVGPAPSHDQYHFVLKTDGHIFWTTNERDAWTISNSTISTNQWIHIAVTAISGSNRKIYINGRLDKNHDTTYTFDSTTNTAKIGYSDRFGSESYFNGIIDEVRIYNRALSAAEIWQLYTDPFCKFYNPMEAELLYTAPAAVARSYGYIIG